MESPELPLLEVVKQVTALLDNVIRGRSVTKEQLHEAGMQLLARSFDAKTESVDLTAHGTKLHNMLRSPRFAQQEGSREFLGFTLLYPVSTPYLFNWTPESYATACAFVHTQTPSVPCGPRPQT
jgi:hypothetical protein